MRSLRDSLFPVVAILGVTGGASLGAQERLEGHWSGGWVREGDELRVECDFVRTDDGYSGFFGSEQLQRIGIPFTRIEFAPPKVHWEIVGDFTTTVFDGRLEGGALTGEFRDGDARGGFRLSRAEAVVNTLREDKVSFRSGEVTLAGTLILPRGTGPHPAVLFLHGSGAEGRWASKFLATELARHGVAGLIYDKRGVGESTGDWQVVGFEELAGDGLAGIEMLRKRAEIDPHRIGVYGHSQGGMIAPMVAVRAADLAFVIASAGSGLPMDELEIYSLENSVGIGSLAPAKATAAKKYIRELVAVAYHGGDRTRVDALWPAVRDLPWEFEIPPKNSYFAFSRRIANYDAIAYWKQVRAPVLLVYGELDERVPPQRSAAKIASALLESGCPQLTVRIFPGADHTFRTHSGPRARFSWPKTASGYLESLTGWITAAASAGDR